MSEHEELVRRSAKACRKRQLERTSTGRAYDPDVEPSESELDNSRAILAEAFRTLEAWPTPFSHRWDEVFWAMLRASPLAPPNP